MQPLVWNLLGIVQPSISDWTSFPLESTSGNDLIRVKFGYLAGARVRGWAWLRCSYQLDADIIFSDSTRIYPSFEAKSLNLAIPADFRERGITTRSFQVKKGLQRYYLRQPHGLDYEWSISVEELLDV